ncbi:TNT domain-containing protein, partial [Amycolatopsis alkalitolerans]
ARPVPPVVPVPPARPVGPPVAGPVAGAAPRRPAESAPPPRQSPPPPANAYAPPQPQPMGAPRQERESIVALFRVHMFPLGHLPVATSRPARQLPVPPPEMDYAPGLRFPPHDHPSSDLIDSAEALEKVRAGYARLPSTAAPPPPALAEGYDPLGGLHERDWERRFLAGTRQSIPEYAWPPGELYPEGGHEPGEPELVPEGTLLDRFGGVRGRVFAPEGTPFVKRSLPPSASHGEYRRYRVLRDIPLWTAVSAPWFAQPGGGIRYRAVYSADELVTMGYLALEEAE